MQRQIYGATPNIPSASAPAPAPLGYTSALDYRDASASPDADYGHNLRTRTSTVGRYTTVTE